MNWARWPETCIPIAGRFPFCSRKWRKVLTGISRNRPKNRRQPYFFVSGFKAVQDFHYENIKGGKIPTRQWRRTAVEVWQCLEITIKMTLLERIDKDWYGGTVFREMAQLWSPIRNWKMPINSGWGDYFTDLENEHHPASLKELIKRKNHNDDCSSSSSITDTVISSSLWRKTVNKVHTTCLKTEGIISIGNEYNKSIR